MDSALVDTEDDSDGLDDSDFQAEAEKYHEYCETRTLELLKAEEERQNVCCPLPCRQNMLT
jgi:hypothetical protein